MKWKFSFHDTVFEAMILSAIDFLQEKEQSNRIKKKCGG